MTVPDMFAVSQVLSGVLLILSYCFLVSQSCPTPATPLTVTCQAPLSMEFPRQKYWSRLPFPSREDLPNPGIAPTSPALQVASYCWAIRKAHLSRMGLFKSLGGTWLMADWDWPLLGHVGPSHVFLISLLGQRASRSCPSPGGGGNAREHVSGSVLSSSVCLAHWHPIGPSKVQGWAQSQVMGQDPHPPSHPQWKFLPSYTAKGVIQGEKRWGIRATAPTYQGLCAKIRILSRNLRSQSRISDQFFTVAHIQWADVCWKNEWMSSVQSLC